MDDNGSGGKLKKSGKVKEMSWKEESRTWNQRIQEMDDKYDNRYGGKLELFNPSFWNTLYGYEWNSYIQLEEGHPIAAFKDGGGHMSTG
ncbi:hypothetical protein M8J76_008048 [Diaphorina citri]|nr:hypothetical protein M8J76_008048 [Diaphorina citri]